MPIPTLARPRWTVFAALALCAIATGCRSAATERSPEGITVAAAANLTQFADSLGKAFEAATGIHPIFSFGSTAQLTQQIENGAPFDVFLSADATHVKELEDKGMLLSGSRAPYAVGVLALWIPDGGAGPIATFESLARPEVRVIALAKPELAPYGQAAVEALHRSGVWDRVKDKIVYAENINMVRQYGASHNADAVFTAYSLVRGDRGQVIRVDESLHDPMVQELGIMAGTEHPGAARRLVEFLRTGAGRSLLVSAGYILP